VPIPAAAPVLPSPTSPLAAAVAEAGAKTHPVVVLPLADAPGAKPSPLRHPDRRTPMSPQMRPASSPAADSVRAELGRARERLFAAQQQLLSTQSELSIATAATARAHAETMELRGQLQAARETAAQAQQEAAVRSCRHSKLWSAVDCEQSARARTAEAEARAVALEGEMRSLRTVRSPPLSVSLYLCRLSCGVQDNADMHLQVLDARRQIEEVSELMTTRATRCADQQCAHSTSTRSATCAPCWQARLTGAVVAGLRTCRCRPRPVKPPSPSRCLPPRPWPRPGLLLWRRLLCSGRHRLRRPWRGMRLVSAHTGAT
jgi:hypothetical protein